MQIGGRNFLNIKNFLYLSMLRYLLDAEQSLSRKIKVIKSKDFYTLRLVTLD
jgi:hypothetical protein